MIAEMVGGCQHFFTTPAAIDRFAFAADNGHMVAALASGQSGASSARMQSMASPFPGMDPYIEACGLWEDFHAKLIGEIERALAPVLPERYVVRTGERSYIVLAPSANGDEHPMVPDIAVVARRGTARRTKRVASTAVAERAGAAHGPATMRALVDTEFREAFLEIRELNPRHRLITSIEVLSPSNKREDSPGWALYVRKRQAHLAGQANLVEIDLLRGGQRMPMADDWPDSPYYLLVARKEESLRCTVWPAFFQHPLLEIPVPLAPPDGDVLLVLKPLVDAVYARSRYEHDIDYRRPLRPPLSSVDAAWLKKHGIGRKA
jgi:hypothetical protein